jgi:hypothetical protein
MIWQMLTFAISLAQAQQKFEKMRALVRYGVVVHSTMKLEALSTI